MNEYDHHFTLEIGEHKVVFFKYCGRWSYCGFYHQDIALKLSEILKAIEIIPEDYAGLDYPEVIKAMEII